MGGRRVTRHSGTGCPSLESEQPGIKDALEKRVDPVMRGDSCSALRWPWKSRAKLTCALVKAGWPASFALKDLRIIRLLAGDLRGVF